MKSERVPGAILLIIPLLIIIGFIFKNPIYWILVDFVVIFITSIIGLLLLLKKNQLNQERVDIIVKILLPIAVFFVSILSFYNSKTADDRIERLYQAQRISDIQVTPIKFEPYFYDNGPMGKLVFQLINYTGFKASNVKVDANIANFSGGWIKEWIRNVAKGLQEKKNKGESLSKEEEKDLKLYKKSSEQAPFELEPNAVKVESFQGGFQYQEGVENKLIIRVSWDNENKAHFDRFYIFRIERSDAGGVHSYILIPVAN